MTDFLVCIVEDDPEVGDWLKQLLSQGGYKTVLHPTPGKLFDWLIKSRPHALLVDMHLPGMDGREIIRILRANPETRGARIVAISGDGPDSKFAVRALEAGADEYLAKPVDPEFLLVRLSGLLTRSLGEPEAEEVLRHGDLSLFTAQRVLRSGGQEIALTRLEFDLLEYFLRHVDRVLTRSTLLQNVWQGDPSMTTGTVNKHVETLRHKLGPAADKIETVVRVGYVMRA